MKATVKPEVTSRPMPGTPYREHTVTLAGVELRTQMHAFTPQEIDEAVQLYLTHGITTPRHQCKSWNLLTPKVVTPRAVVDDDPLRGAYESLYLED